MSILLDPDAYLSTFKKNDRFLWGLGEFTSSWAIIRKAYQNLMDLIRFTSYDHKLVSLKQVRRGRVCQ